MDESTESMVTMKYIIKLPVKVGENNASEVSEDGKTLTWNLKAGETNEISFEAESNYLTTIIMISIAILLVIIILIVVFLNKGKKNKKSDELVDKEEETEEKIQEVEEDKKEE